MKVDRITMFLVVDDVLNNDDDTTWPYLLLPVSALPFLSMNAFEMHSLPLSLYFQSHILDMWKHLSSHVMLSICSCNIIPLVLNLNLLIITTNNTIGQTPNHI